MPDSSLPAHWAARLSLLACLTGITILASIRFWHLLTPESWHWLSAEGIGDIETAGLGLMAGAAICAGYARYTRLAAHNRA